uniref:ARAD1B02090p n=1 Tax=Blastobotrys adeninivorans TaxID=409370 RepID=A0A060T4T3_BLAAD
MKAKALTVHWHQDNQPIYSAHFQPGGNRVATGGGDNNVRLWKLEYNSAGTEVQSVTYLSTLSRHTQAVNAVRFDPKGTVLASAGDDGTVLLWTRSEGGPVTDMSSDSQGLDDRETWKLRHACRASVSEIYDIAWSPDSQYIIAGSMDNVARIYNAANGQCIRQLAEHSHYVQGVAWDPMNEYIATQSSDRSVHIYALKTKDGQFTLSNHQKISRTELPARRALSHTPDKRALTITTGSTNTSTASNSGNNGGGAHTSAIGRPPASPSTPRVQRSQSQDTDSSSGMPPPLSSSSRTHSRKSSFSSNLNRSESPSPSIPLPAVMQLGSPSLGSASPVMAVSKGVMSYHNETFTSFFRRLTFAPDGALLFTPSGLYKYQESASEETTNTVYIYTRAGLNRPPVAHLPGLKKPSLAVKCSPVRYALRDSSDKSSEAGAQKKPVTKHITIDSSVPDLSLPDSVETEADKDKDQIRYDRKLDSPVFSLPYRIIYAVATQDSVIVYDTQQTSPICVVSNLHYATFTDLTWSPDGNTLLMTSTDGFASVIVFEPGELGQLYDDPAVPTATAATAADTPTTATTTSATSTNTTPLTSATTNSSTPTASAASDEFVKPATPIPSSAGSASPAESNLVPVVSHVPSVMIGGQSGHSSPAPPDSPSSKRPQASDKSSDKPEAKKKRRIAPTLATPQ